MEHQVKYGTGFVKALQTLDNKVLKKLYANFVVPIQNGLTPPEELEGKYKPSWEVKYSQSIIQDAFMKEAVKYNLHHYHFGYHFYKDGNDPDYDGHVSDGIIHTRIEVEDKVTRHIITELCLDHSPFKIPFDTAFDKAV
ncbi:hypothetical protein [Moritella sp.]|uniref:hypothetical protein n=1 Tax=Moritella sp. TaxID=78556 RepID=UPI001D2E571E|nr:hypothetical protein [Moritella sp.]MCJ8350754.1 hypothetical protein [Moritella sp.]NQZ42013.1 hypothetical protein [Moritella sp.]